MADPSKDFNVLLEMEAAHKQFAGERGREIDGMRERLSKVEPILKTPLEYAADAPSIRMPDGEDIETEFEPGELDERYEIFSEFGMFFPTKKAMREINQLGFCAATLINGESLASPVGRPLRLMDARFYRLLNPSADALEGASMYFFKADDRGIVFPIVDGFYQKGRRIWDWTLRRKGVQLVKNSAGQPITYPFFVTSGRVILAPLSVDFYRLKEDKGVKKHQSFFEMASKIGSKLGEPTLQYFYT